MNTTLQLKQLEKQEQRSIISSCAAGSLGLNLPQNIRRGFGVERMWNPLGIPGREQLVRLGHRNVMVQRSLVREQSPLPYWSGQLWGRARVPHGPEHVLLS